jgi:hypothetical protein
MKKIALLMTMLFAFAGIANAVTLSAPQEIPASVNWSFTANFDNFNFNEAKFFLDDKPLATIFTYNSALFLAPNSIDNSLVLNISISENNVFASMAGISEGEHNLRVDLFSNGQKIDSVSAKIIVSNSLDSGYKTEIQKNLDSLKASVNAFAVEINQLKSDASDLQASKTDSEQKVSSIFSALEELKSKIEKIDGEIMLLISDIEYLKQNPVLQEKNQPEQKSFLESLVGGNSKEKQAAETQPAEEQTTNNDSNEPIASAPLPLFSLGTSGTLLWIFIGLLIVLAAIVVFRIAKEKDFTMGSGLKSYNEDQGVLGSNVMQGNTDNQKQGKWSFEKQPEKKQPSSSGLHFGNLLRRSH